MNDPSIDGTLLALGTATLGESGAARATDPPGPMWPGAAVAGRILPVRCVPGDNLAIHAAVAKARAGDVLVVDVGSRPSFGYWGEVLTVAAMSRGIVGLVIDGCIRDVDAIERHRFPAFARGTALPGASKTRGGTIGAPVVMADLELISGDWLVADRDGMVVVPQDGGAAIVAAGSNRERTEAEMFERLRAGATTVELLGLDVSPIERASPTDRS